MNVKITINNEERIVVIPMNYDNEKDELSFGEIQIEPMPSDNDDISKDIVLNISQIIISAFKSI